MPLVVPDVGECKALDNWLGAEDRTLKLYRTDVTPGESDTLATYTVANFTSYVDKTLTAGSWNAASTSSGTSSKTYAQQSWSPGSSQTIYGYYVVAADGTTLAWAEKFASSRSLVSGDTLYLTPRMELA